MALTLTFAMLLDALLGEPKWLWGRLPHPAVLMGRLVGWCDARFNQGTNRKAKGVVVMIALSLAAWIAGHVLSLLGPIPECLIAAVLLAQRSLVDHVTRVADGLRLSLPAGQQAVAMIVSRDTTDMAESAVARSAIESAAENLSDGVIAPALWFLVAGLPGLLLYKITNTADSMIGYRTDRHRDFGWAAARFDDLLNLLPARLTAVLIALPGGVLAQWRDIASDARRHKSPNAGWPEAAMARALDIALAGPRTYDGARQDFPFVHPEGRRTLTATDIDAATRQLWQAWRVMLGLTAALAVLTL